MSENDRARLEDQAAQSFAAVGSVAATHPAERRFLAHAVSPNTSDHNTLTPVLAAVGCWRLNRAVFALDSSFLQPGVREETPRFAALVASMPEALASVFGHADPSGTDAYNKPLSDRRAMVVYGMLTRDVALWEQLYSEPHQGDPWGAPVLRRMLATLPAASGAPYYAGPVEHDDYGARIKAVKAFQGDNGLAVDGDAGPLTRAALFLAYMNALCVDASGAPFVMTPAQFLGGESEPGGKGSVQGCGEFNPVFLFSKAEEAAFAQGKDKATRDGENAVNRRTMVFLFRASGPIDPAGWPCPRVKEDGAACRSMFWPDGDARRAAGAVRREYRTDRKTMACSWYDRFARRSPCEGVAPPVRGNFERDEPAAASEHGFGAADPSAPGSGTTPKSD